MSTSPIKDSSPPKTEKSLFTEKEERVLKAAWHCLKSPPEIDIDKLRVAADFNTTKTASNTWGVIKKKLATLAPAEGDGGGKCSRSRIMTRELLIADNCFARAIDSPVATPKSKFTPKKRGKKASVEDDDDDEAETPTKKRKTPKVVKAGENELLADEGVKAEED